MRIDKSEIALKAKQLRKMYDIQSNGIPDIFDFVDQQGIELIRYPFGRNAVLGFASVYEGKRIIVSNSSEILSREIYTVAHELGHILYDFCDDSSRVKVDKDHGENRELSISEERAFYFADCLLMPEEQLVEVIRDKFKKIPSELRAINIVQMQLEFKVSFSALLQRLYDLQLFTKEKKEQLYKEREFYTSSKLFELLGADEELLKPSEKLVVPPRYIDFVMSNYENNYIPLSSLKKALDLVGMDTSGLSERHREVADEDVDQLFEEYE